MPEGRKQKVLIVHNYYQIPGGEDTVVANEKKLLEDHGHEVILYTRHNNELKTMGKLKKLLLPFTTIYNPKTARDVKRIIKEQSVDIVHVHNTLNLVSPSVYYAARRCNVPVVQTIHNYRLLCPGATFYRDGHICEDCVSKGLGCAVKHACYRGSKAQTLVCVISTKFHRMTGIYGKINYIALTEFGKEKLLQHKQIKSEQVFVKPNFTFESPEIRGGGYDDYYLFIGRIEEIKGIDVLLNAFAKMPERKLRLAGNGPLLDEKERWVERNGLSNITFLGFLDKEKLSREIAGAKAVILPTQVYEGFPMTIPEAFQLHKPMIVSDLGNAGALIEDGVTGVKFTHNDPTSLVDAIERLEDMDLGKLGQAAYEVFEKEYSAEANYRKLMRIYKEVERGL